MAKINGGELVVRTLIQAGVDKIFALHGAHIDTIFQACIDHSVSIIDTRHEAAAGHAAEGYARAVNRLGVALVTAGGGFTNSLTSIANAYLDRTPVLYITGSGSMSHAETNTLQAGLDQVAMAKPVTKWATQVTVTANIPRILAQALRIAQSGPRGPVLIDIPWDILMGLVDEAEVSIPRALSAGNPPAPPAEVVKEMLRVLAAASRPVIVLGSEATRSGSAQVAAAFADCSGIPVFADYEGIGLLSASHRQCAGLVQNMLNLNIATPPDLVLMLGVRFGLYTGHGSGILIPKSARVIQVDTDSREFGRLQDIDTAIIADPRETLFALTLAASDVRWANLSGWTDTVRRAGTSRRARIDAGSADAIPIHPFRAAKRIADSLPENAIIVADGAEAYTWFTEVVAPRAPGRFLTHSYLGSMGIGMGLALGAQAATGQPVILVTGDGAVGFSLAEFETMVRLNLPVVVIVMNNRAWGATLHFQQAIVGAHRVHHTSLTNGAYHDVAAAFGAWSCRVNELFALADAIKGALDSGRPACIDVQIALDPAPPETRLMMGDNPFA